ncbi:MAG TPA: hypothetical protein DEQ32_18630 [Gammaproteobacteria bacterium]|nr:hypothetical protein [Gammaproteobacteria bacterium]
MDISKPISLSSPEFIADKWAIFERLREEQPISKIKVSVLTLYGISRFDDCDMLLNDPRLVRNRTTATGGGSRLPFPIPKSVSVLMESMIQEDDPNHRRLRELVRKAFQPQAIKTLEERIEGYSDELLGGLNKNSGFELQNDYARHIPERMIADMVGIGHDQMPQFRSLMGSLSEGFSGLRILRTFILDMPKHLRFVREIVREKKTNPGEDILTHLIFAEEDGDRLSEDEVVAMVFLLVIAGFETTVHLITNGVHTLLQHPDQLEILRADPSLWASAVEEILRHRGPVQGTKPGWATEDIELHGVTIPKGKPIMPLLGAANHDPRKFDNPLSFDITRSPNHHLGFSHGIHYCLGAHLARAEARIGLRKLFERFPNIDFAVDPNELELQNLPAWHRYKQMPLSTGALS